jgi:hypothetical protein
LGMRTPAGTSSSLVSSLSIAMAEVLSPSGCRGYPSGRACPAPSHPRRGGRAAR